MPEIIIDEGRHEVFVQGKRVFLPPVEFRLLVALRSSNKTMNRKDLFSIIGGRRKSAIRVVDAHVSRLRRRMGVSIIETVTKFGYKWVGG